MVHTRESCSIHSLRSPHPHSCGSSGLHWERHFTLRPGKSRPTNSVPVAFRRHPSPMLRMKKARARPAPLPPWRNTRTRLLNQGSDDDVARRCQRPSSLAAAAAKFNRAWLLDAVRRRLNAQKKTQECIASSSKASVRPSYLGDYIRHLDRGGRSRRAQLLDAGLAGRSKALHYSGRNPRLSCHGDASFACLSWRGSNKTVRLRRRQRLWHPVKRWRKR